MYFNHVDIDRKLTCPKCEKRFVAPVLLITGCNNSICKTCFDQVKINENLEFKCPICKMVHSRPNNGFPVNRLVEEILEIPSYSKVHNPKTQLLIDDFKKVQGKFNLLNRDETQVI